jgi:hypothetical protein
MSFFFTEYANLLNFLNHLWIHKFMMPFFGYVLSLIQLWIPLMWIWLWYFIQHIHLCVCIFRWL